MKWAKGAAIEEILIKQKTDNRNNSYAWLLEE